MSDCIEISFCIVGSQCVYMPLNTQIACSDNRIYPLQGVGHLWPSQASAWQD